MDSILLEIDLPVGTYSYAFVLLYSTITYIYKSGEKTLVNGLFYDASCYLFRNRVLYHTLKSLFSILKEAVTLNFATVQSIFVVDS